MYCIVAISLCNPVNICICEFNYAMVLMDNRIGLEVVCMVTTMSSDIKLQAQVSNSTDTDKVVTYNV